MSRLWEKEFLEHCEDREQESEYGHNDDDEREQDEPEHARTDEHIHNPIDDDFDITTTCSVCSSRRWAVA